MMFFTLPSHPDRSTYITEDERVIVHTWLNKDSLGKGHTGIDWRGVWCTLTDWKTYVISITYSAMNLTLGSISGFLPTIIKGWIHLIVQSLWHSDNFLSPGWVTLLQMLNYSLFHLMLLLWWPCISFHSCLIMHAYKGHLLLLYSWFHKAAFLSLHPHLYLHRIVGWATLLTILNNNKVWYFGCICIVIGRYNAIPLYTTSLSLTFWPYISIGLFLGSQTILAHRASAL